MKFFSTFAALLAAVVLFVNVPAVAQEKGKTAAAELTADSQKALAALVAKVPLAKALQPKATAILVFPSVKKAGLGIGGQYGEGTLLKAATPPRSTRPPARRWAFRPAHSSTATRCS
jgi:lipid-binding SYLF domain-containing protein